MSYIVTISEETPSAQSGLLTDKKELYRQVLADIYGPEGIKKIVRRINAEESGEAAKQYIPKPLGPIYREPPYDEQAFKVTC